jgi:iron complex transport system substrate-binding protein
LLPSATEIVCALGLGDQLVGVTHECDYPLFVRDLPRVTRTLILHDATSRQIDELVRERSKTQRALYTLDMPKLEQLRPELIVTQALCDVCAVAEAEVKAAACSLPGHPRVVNLEPTRLADVFDGFRLVATAAGVPQNAERVIASLQDRVDTVTAQSARITHWPRVVLLEWIDPPFCSGHWSPELVRLAGGVEGIGQEGRPSRTTAWNEIIAFDPEVLVIACCGFTTERTLHDLSILRSYPQFDRLAAVNARKVFVVDGNAYFSRPGPRLVDSLEIIAHILHPHVFLLPPGPAAPHRLTVEELGIKEAMAT